MRGDFWASMYRVAGAAWPSSNAQQKRRKGREKGAALGFSLAAQPCCSLDSLSRAQGQARTATRLREQTQRVVKCSSRKGTPPAPGADCLSAPNALGGGCHRTGKRKPESQKGEKLCLFFISIAGNAASSSAPVQSTGRDDVSPKHFKICSAAVPRLCVVKCMHAERFSTPPARAAATSARRSLSVKISY